jgi:hypothetical protein
MNDFLACAGINGDEKSVKKLVELANSRKPNTILFAGGIAKTDSDLSQKRNFMAKCLEVLGKSGHQIILIPGPHDSPLGEFLRLAIKC